MRIYLVPLIMCLAVSLVGIWLGIQVERLRTRARRGEIIAHIKGKVYLVAGGWMAVTEIKRTVRGATAYFRDLRALSELDAIARAEGCLSDRVEILGVKRKEIEEHIEAHQDLTQKAKKVREFSMKLPPKPENKPEPGEGQPQ